MFELRRYGVRLYVAFVMTRYLAFTTSGRTAKAVRPVISGKFSIRQNVYMKKLVYIAENSDSIEDGQRPNCRLKISVIIIEDVIGRLTNYYI